MDRRINSAANKNKQNITAERGGVHQQIKPNRIVIIICQGNGECKRQTRKSEKIIARQV